MPPSETATTPPPVPPPARQLRRRAVEAAFLPAALEVLETPPSPVGRAITWAICGSLVCALAWAWFGRVDVIAVAPGRIVPTEAVKSVQPLEAGVVRAIHVKEGQTVAAGAPLVDLDPTEMAAERDRLARDRLEAAVEAARLSAELEAVASDALDTASFAPPAGTPADLAAVHRRLLRGQLAAHRAELSALASELAEKRAERDGIAAELTKLERRLPLLRQRVEARRSLAARDLTPRMEALELEEALVTAEADRTIQQHRLTQVEATLRTLADRLARTEAQFRVDALDGLAKAEQRRAGLDQELVKAEDRLRRRRLAAPIDGTVQQLTVHTLGGVVTPAETLMVLVPKDSPLEIEALVAGRDIGFVREGQAAAVKVDTFAFTRYGLIEGQVRQVSRDAVTPSPGQAVARGSGGMAGAGMAAAQGAAEPVYTARVSLDRTAMRIDGADVPLAPGMGVSVEIKTGRRRVLEYLLDPVARARDEALRER